MTADGITTGQRNRQALVYIRQSSPQQIARNPESQRRQRGFVNRIRCSWAGRQTVSASSTRIWGSREHDRPAARASSRWWPWRRWAVSGSFSLWKSRGWPAAMAIGTSCWTSVRSQVSSLPMRKGSTIRRPTTIGSCWVLKGTMSEAELHLIKQRLVEGMRAKARRGELRRRLPRGFVWDQAGRIVKDPDEQVVAAIDEIPLLSQSGHDRSDAAVADRPRGGDSGTDRARDAAVEPPQYWSGGTDAEESHLRRSLRLWPPPGRGATGRVSEAAEANAGSRAAAVAIHC